MSDDLHRDSKRSWTGCLLIALTLFLLPFGGLCFLAGGIVGQQQLYDRWTQEKIETLQPLLEDSRFSHLTIDHSSAAQVYFAEAEIAQEDFAALEEEVTHLLGREEADQVLASLKWSIEERARKLLEGNEEAEQP